MQLKQPLNKVPGLGTLIENTENVTEQNGASTWKCRNVNQWLINSASSEESWFHYYQCFDDYCHRLQLTFGPAESIDICSQWLITASDLLWSVWEQFRLVSIIRANVHDWSIASQPSEHNPRTINQLDIAYLVNTEASGLMWEWVFTGVWAIVQTC